MTGWASQPNNIAAINSLIVYRALRYGRHLDLILTDERGHRGPDAFDKSATDKLADWADYGMFPDDLLQVLDGGRAFNGGNPPAELEFNGAKVPNPARTTRRRPSSEEPRKRGSRINLSGRPRPGRSGAVRKPR